MLINQVLVVAPFISLTSCSLSIVFILLLPVFLHSSIFIMVELTSLHFTADVMYILHMTIKFLEKQCLNSG